MTKGETMASDQIMLAVEHPGTTTARQHPGDAKAYLDAAVLPRLDVFIKLGDGLICGQDHVSARQYPEVTPGSCRASCRLAA
jgi:hypothetical protein